MRHGGVAAVLLLVLARSAAAMDEVPFVTSPEPVTRTMLALARVGPRDVVFDLGSGDGRIVIAAAKHFGARGVGVELSPDLVVRSRDNAVRAGVADRAEFRVQDLFETDLAAATVVTMYLLPEVNLQLRPKLLALKPGTRIVSHDWDMADWQPDRTVVVDAPDKPVGLEKKSRVHLWVVPARVDGQWCAGATRLRLEQAFQVLSGELLHNGLLSRVESRLQGVGFAIGLPGGGARLALQGERLRVTAGSGVLAGLRGAAFRRDDGSGCR
jgi:SAM-dependent methyltransferase